MRLVVDLQGLQNGSRLRGIGRYVASLAQEVSRLMPPEQLRFVLSDLFPETVSSIIETFQPYARPDQFVVFSGVGPTHELDQNNRWRLAATELLYEDFLSRIGPDNVLIGTTIEGASDNSIATFPNEERGYGVATVLYDLIPYLDPKSHLHSKQAEKWYHRRLQKLLDADVMFAISNSARNEAVNHLGVSPNKIVEIGSAASSFFVDEPMPPKSHASALCMYFGIDRPYIMFASALDSRKNFEGLIQAFACLPSAVQKSHQLVLVCKLSEQQRHHLASKIHQVGLVEGVDVVLTGFVSDEDLKLLYGHCQLFVFPSFHEGFGLPIVEAMWCGAPVIGSNRSSVPEAVGMSEALFDPSDCDAMATLIQKALQDGAFRDKLLKHIVQHRQKFVWRSVAERALSALSERQITGSVIPHFASDRALVEAMASWTGKQGPTNHDFALLARAITANKKVAEACWNPTKVD